MKKPPQNYVAFQKQHLLSCCVDTISEKNALFSLYNLRWSLFFYDKFGSQSSLQISLPVAVGKKISTSVQTVS